MDSLARNAMLARQAGMSYGKWKALQPREEPKEKTLPEGWSKCEYCGKAFKLLNGRKKLYCDAYCGRYAYYQKNREKLLAYEKQRKAKKAEGGNGDG